MIVVRKSAFQPGAIEFYIEIAGLDRILSVLWNILWLVPYQCKWIISPYIMLLHACCQLICYFCRYDSCMEATDSDHKPVKCVFNLDVAHVDKQTMRQKYGEIMTSNKKVLYLLQGLEAFPEVNISTKDIILQDQNPSVVKLQNRSTKELACFEIIGQTPNSSGTPFSGFPSWLKVGYCFVFIIVIIILHQGTSIEHSLVSIAWDMNYTQMTHVNVDATECLVTCLLSKS